MNMANPVSASRLSDEAMRRIHKNWMRRYGILYADNEEEERRFRIFKKTFEAMEKHNTEEDSYFLLLSPYSDRTFEEFFVLYSNIRGEVPDDMLDDIILRNHLRRRGANHPSIYEEGERIIHPFTQDDRNPPFIW